uniref:Peptidase A1 domain-containing protein n=1 Tax=Gongylonema pulchrum TaxID=637853 RepID=A0A183EW56_9BILA
LRCRVALRVYRPAAAAAAGEALVLIGIPIRAAQEQQAVELDFGQFGFGVGFISVMRILPETFVVLDMATLER